MSDKYDQNKLPDNAKIVIQRYPPSAIPRATEVPMNFREENESAYASRMGGKEHENNSTFKDVYEFYQNNEY